MSYLSLPGLQEQIRYIKSYVASLYAPKASPVFTGTPTAPTATSGTNTAQLATTEFVQSALSNIVPIIISNDTTMPNSVNNNGVWFQLTGDTSITNGESVEY